MIITNNKGRVLNDINTWGKGFIEVDDEKHWKKGRSAYSLAEFILKYNGMQLINNLLMKVSGRKLDITTAQKACIEYESKFDKYKGHGRMHDLAIFNENDSYFIGIEAKVDETFGDTIFESYAKGLNSKKGNSSSNKAQRVLELIKRFYKQKKLSDKDEIGNYRYQLLTYLAGSLAENAKLVLMPILVFHTKEFPIKNNSTNKHDYINFMHSLSFKEAQTEEGYLLFYKNIDNKDVFSYYIEIDLRE